MSVISADHFQAYEPLLEDVVSHRFEDVEHGSYMQKGHLENIHYSNAAGKLNLCHRGHITRHQDDLDYSENTVVQVASYSEKVE